MIVKKPDPSELGDPQEEPKEEPKEETKRRSRGPSGALSSPGSLGGNYLDPIYLNCLFV